MQAVTAVDPDSATNLLVACSGGADSLALAAAAHLAASHTGLATHAIVIDHGLQDGSAEVAAGVESQLRRLGYQHVRRVRVTVTDRGTGPEAAAREARYNALSEAAEELDAVVLLGHTMDDQAETVLLGLARGSGTRSLAGMPAQRGRFRRPLLGIRRRQTVAACAELGLRPWHDPHNADSSYTRVRVRERVLPVLATELGPGIVEALARTAEQAAVDADLLDELAAEALEELRTGEGELDVAELITRPAAIRHRVLLRWMRTSGARDLAHRHVLAVDQLLTDWRGQQGVDVPGMRVVRRAGRLNAVAG
ncbi:tRNA lysidine(34) synthetase TilS [Enemella sp. A6]|uniref:tRNA lysidine(34) synthetase TilS n=1 Tax=Enemella sp. A6 TaxID=3440152 RepID=UPI003EB7E919